MWVKVREEREGAKEDWRDGKRRGRVGKRKGLAEPEVEFNTCPCVGAPH